MKEITYFLYQVTVLAAVVFLLLICVDVVVVIFVSADAPASTADTKQTNLKLQLINKRTSIENKILKLWFLFELHYCT